MKRLGYWRNYGCSLCFHAYEGQLLSHYSILYFYEGGLSFIKELLLYQSFRCFDFFLMLKRCLRVKALFLCQHYYCINIIFTARWTHNFSFRLIYEIVWNLSLVSILIQFFKMCKYYMHHLWYTKLYKASPLYLSKKKKCILVICSNCDSCRFLIFRWFSLYLCWYFVCIVFLLIYLLCVY